MCYLCYVCNKINALNKKKIEDCQTDQIIGYTHRWIPCTDCASHCNVTRNDVQNDRIFLPHISFQREKLPWEATKWLETHSEEKICVLIIGEKVQYDRLK